MARRSTDGICSLREAVPEIALVMRSVALGHGHYFYWHLPTLVIVAIAAVVGALVARQLARGAYGPHARTLRWSIVGWCSLAVAVGSAVVTPYLRDAAHWRIEADGAWSFRNYLGVPVARVPADELRQVRARDLGGLGVGMGHVEVRRADGSVVRTVRVSRSALAALTAALGYARADLVQEYTDTVVRPHRYDAQGPSLR
jgi:hypothetical protein